MVCVFLQRLNFLTKQSFDASGVRIWKFSLYGMFQFTLPYALWSNFPHDVMITSLRIVGILLCLLLLFKDEWPKQLKKNTPLFWYGTLGYCLSFATIYTLLVSHFSPVWIIHTSLGMILLMWFAKQGLFLFLMTFFGILAAFFYLMIHGLQAMGLQEIIFFFYAFFMTLIVGNVLSKRQEVPEAPQSLEIVCDHMAHEIRTPLATLTLSLQSIERLMFSFIDGYSLAKKAGLPVRNIGEVEIANFKGVFERMHLILRRAFVIIDRIVMNLRTHFEHFPHECLSVKGCVESALENYPMNHQERRLITFDSSNDFSFSGNKALIANILFNLLKNALFQIKRAGRGEITIWATYGPDKNSLHVRDTACGVNDAMRLYLFDRYHVKDKSGLGLGLSFCKRAMNVMGGDIYCEAKQGEFAEFILSFPKGDSSNEAMGNQ